MIYTYPKLYDTHIQSKTIIYPAMYGNAIANLPNIYPMKNTLRSPAYMKVRDVIRSCKHLAHWETANTVLNIYEKKWTAEYGLRIELTEKFKALHA